MDVLKMIRLQWDRAAGIALALLGGIVILLGWRGAADAVYPAQQLPYVISGGLFGLFLLGIAGTLWLSADLKDEWRQTQQHLALTTVGDEGRASTPGVLAEEKEPGRPTDAPTATPLLAKVPRGL